MIVGIGIMAFLFGLTLTSLLICDPQRLHWPASWRRGKPEPSKHPTPAINDLIKAHLNLRDLDAIWRRDLCMWALYRKTPAGQLQELYPGFLVLVSDYAHHYQWGNAMDAVMCDKHLPSHYTENIMSAHNLYMPPAAPVLITKTKP